MFSSIQDLFRRSHLAQVMIVILVGISAWWVSMYARNLTEGLENDAFTLIYPWTSLIGAVWGLLVAKQWGGFKSVMGKTISLFSLGLFAQFFGQAAYAIYIYVFGIEVPYPSIGDLGYFGSVIFYIIAVMYLARAMGAHLSLRSYRGMVQAIVIPVVMLALSYSVFLREYEFDFGAPVQLFLDFGYPLGQAFYISLAILAFSLSRKYLGGLMRGPILFIIFALVVQYICDYTFLYQVSQEEWYVGGVNDYLYFLSYVVMTLALGNMGILLQKIRAS